MPLRHRGYGAYISCDGEELKTYNVKQKGRIISCYVLGEAEKVNALSLIKRNHEFSLLKGPSSLLDRLEAPNAPIY